MINSSVSIIIVHWNTPDVLKAQLKLLCGFEGEIIVVDNNSADNVDWIKNEFSKVKFIQNKINHGYAFACNQGA